MGQTSKIKLLRSTAPQIPVSQSASSLPHGGSGRVCTANPGVEVVALFRAAPSQIHQSTIVIKLRFLLLPSSTPIETFPTHNALYPLASKISQCIRSNHLIAIIILRRLSPCGTHQDTQRHSELRSQTVCKQPHIANTAKNLQHLFERRTYISRRILIRELHLPIIRSNSTSHKRKNIYRSFRKTVLRVRKSNMDGVFGKGTPHRRYRHPDPNRRKRTLEPRDHELRKARRDRRRPNGVCSIHEPLPLL